MGALQVGQSTLSSSRATRHPAFRYHEPRKGFSTGAVLGKVPTG